MDEQPIIVNIINDSLDEKERKQRREDVIDLLIWAGLFFASKYILYRFIRKSIQELYRQK